MDIGTFEKAKKIVESLKIIETALKQIENARHDIITTNNNFPCILSGSNGVNTWQITLSGTSDSLDYIDAAEKVLFRNKEVLERKLIII